MVETRELSDKKELVSAGTYEASKEVYYNLMNRFLRTTPESFRIVTDAPFHGQTLNVFHWNDCTVELRYDEPSPVMDLFIWGLYHFVGGKKIYLTVYGKQLSRDIAFGTLEQKILEANGKKLN